MKPYSYKLTKGKSRPKSLSILVDRYKKEALITLEFSRAEILRYFEKKGVVSYTSGNMSPESEKTGVDKSVPLSTPVDDDVVISGIAGRFPESDDVTILKENLFNKRDLVTNDDRRWKSNHLDIPQWSGKVNNVEKFDSEFFGAQFKDAHIIDPMGRMLLEHAYEAIVDAGVNPRQLRGTNIGVFVSSIFGETESEYMYKENGVGRSGVLGCSRSLLANRISYWLGTTGPSYNVDAACSATLHAIDHAYRAIKSGECDAALVGAPQLCLSPFITLQFKMLGLLSAEGRCKSFDANADGYGRSETICVIYLQKAKDARRSYANLVHSKLNCDGFTEHGITHPSSTMQTALLKQFYEECRVSPTSLAFLEAHGSGTIVGDPIELMSIDEVFCQGRTTPLKIGSIKSNLGHSEAASAACSIVKVLIAMESGYIPPNLHFNCPHQHMKALVEGRAEIITELTPWDGGYVGVNSFGFGGANAHILLKSNPKEKINNGAPDDDLPRLVVVSGRTQEAVKTLLDDLESRPIDAEFVSLFHNIHSEEIPGHLYRGYTILPPQNSQDTPVRNVQYYRSIKRPVWFMFSGMGSPWAGMGKALLKIPIFLKATQKCDAILKPRGVDIIDILTTEDPKIFKSDLSSFVGIAVIQIGLVDVLGSIGIVPDNIIGYSIGELGCAYADGYLTAEQTVLLAYYRGLASVNTETIPEPLATVGLSRMDPENLCSSDQELVCENGSQCSTNSSQSLDFMRKLVDKLLVNKTDRDGSNVVPDPETRSQKWLNAFVLCEKWEKNPEMLFSREFYTNNPLADSPVSFEKIFRAVPNGTIVIEITAQGLLQTISRSSLTEKIDSIALANHDHTDHMGLLLQGIGRMYEFGLHPQLINLYPEVQYPVSRGTPMISPLVRWEHSKDWYVHKHTTQKKMATGERVVEISLAVEAFESMAGHVIDGRILVPATGYLVLIWETVALMQGKLYEEVPIVFEDVKFHRATTIPEQGSIQLIIMVHKGSGRFEVSEGITAVVTGVVRVYLDSTEKCIGTDTLNHIDEPLDLAEEDIYKELRLRGCHYAGLYRSLKRSSLKGTTASLAWKDNWESFIDGMIQMQFLGYKSRGLFIPTSIQKLALNPEAHFKQARALPHDDKVFTAKMYKDLDIVVSSGVELRGTKFNAITRRKLTGGPVLENFQFVAHLDRAVMDLRVATRIAVHIALENQMGIAMKTIELIGKANDKSLDNLTSPLIEEILNDWPSIQADVNIIAPLGTFLATTLPPTIRISEPKQLASESGALLTISHGLLASKDIETLNELKRAMRDSGFLLAREPLNADGDIFSTIGREKLDIILEKRIDKELVFLLRKRPELAKVMTVIRVNNDEFTWLPKLQATLKAVSVKKSKTDRILLVSEGDFESGLMGLVNCLRKEPSGQCIQALLIQDLQAPKFSLKNQFYSKQLDLGLALNVLRPNNVWGTYRFMAMEPLPPRPVHHVQISQLANGDLRSLKWVQGSIRPGYQHKDIIAVHYSSINFRDVMMSTGKLAAEEPTKRKKAWEHVIGFEFSGRDMNGQAVMGMIRSGAFSNLCISDSELIWSVPDNWTLEDAATVPVVYGTAYYALTIKGKMKKGDKVLIHAGSGGVGQAAITLALHEGCEVFTTVGTLQKREFIKNQFPQIDDDHIGSSRNTSFEQMIFRRTQGRGVDIVLNSLAEEKLLASVRCLAEGGRFLEIGKFDLAANNSIGMELFLKGISFHGIFLDNLFNTSSDQKAQLVGMLAEGLISGAVKPLVRTVFLMDQVEAAFRYMAAGKHIGKVILKMRDENEASKSSLPRGIPLHYCSEDGSNLILGGLGGFGLELADWLVLRGAKKLILASRRGITNGYQRMRINVWKNCGVEVIIIAGKDASTHKGCEEILREAAALGPVEGIFHLAVVLKDALFENQTVESFEESFRVKAWTTKQLDKLSRTLCPHLRQFVVFSSVSCGRGNAGQTNYGMSNSVMERICEARAAEGLPGLAVQWGAIGDVGLLAGLQKDSTEIVIGGTLPQSISSCLQEFDGFLQQNLPVVSSIVVAEKKTKDKETATILAAVKMIMGLKSFKTIGMHTPLTELGMDSMMAVEIKQTLERDFGVFLTAEEIRALNLTEVEKISLKQCGPQKSQGMVRDDKNHSNGFELSIKKLGLEPNNENIRTPLMTVA